MNIVFRVDASIEMGIGHVMRCLTLADALSDAGVQSHFVCREHPGNLIDQITRRGHQVHPLPRCQTGHRAVGIETQKSQLEHAHWLGCDWLTDAQQTLNSIASLDADWLIVDHYALDERWEKLLRPACNKIMVIDDLADRYHDCDLLLDQNYYGKLKARYEGLLPSYCIQLLGPEYTILRSEFIDARGALKGRNGIVKNLLIFFGGSDYTNETFKALDALRLLNRPDVVAHVVVGASNPHKNQIKSMCSRLPNTKYHCQVSNMAELLLNADLALAAGGSATLERCFLGLPALTVVTAENQRAVTMAVEKAGAILNMGNSHGVSAQNFAQAMVDICSHPTRLISMGKSGLKIMGGNSYSGVAGVVSAMIN